MTRFVVRTTADGNVRCHTYVQAASFYEYLTASCALVRTALGDGWGGGKRKLAAARSHRSRSWLRKLTRLAVVACIHPRTVDEKKSNGSVLPSLHLDAERAGARGHHEHGAVIYQPLHLGLHVACLLFQGEHGATSAQRRRQACRNGERSDFVKVEKRLSASIFRYIHASV